MQYFVQRSELRDLYEKVAGGARISEAEALRLFESKDLNTLGAMADLVRQRKVGNRASYILNRYINYSNYCILSCQFCAFARKKRDADGFQFSVEEIVQKASEALKLGITELHIVGGLHPNLPFSFYTDMLRALKGLNSRLQLKCFTAIEILHLAWLAKKSVEETLRELKAAGLDSLTGGGAEIFRPAIRSAIAKGKNQPRSIWMCIEPGIAWEAAPPAPCSTATSSPWMTGWIICGNFVNCRMKRVDSSLSFRSLTTRQTIKFRSNTGQPVSTLYGPWP